MAIATLEIHNRLSDTCMEPRKVKTPKPPRSITVNRQFGDGQVEVVLKGSARKEIPFELDDNTGLWRIANTRTKPNLFMAIGLESDKYREELLGEYIQLMATYGEKSTIIIADELLTLNGNIFGLDTPVRPTIEEKEKLVKRLIEDVGDPDRMGIMLWSDISHHSRSKIIRSAVREVYRTEEMKIESGRTIRHKHTPLECDLQDCVYGNMKTRVAAHAKQVGRNQFEIDFQKMVDYVIAEVSGILCLIQGNIPSKISYPIKVGLNSI